MAAAITTFYCSRRSARTVSLSLNQRHRRCLVGLARATVGVNLGERINIGGGLGANLLGLQVAGYLRLRPLVSQLQAAPDHVGALALEMAYVRGPSRGVLFGGGFQGEQPDYSWNVVHWAQFGVFYEKIISTRFVASIGVSLAFPIASRDCKGTAQDESSIACDSSIKPKPLIGFTYAIGPAILCRRPTETRGACDWRALGGGSFRRSRQWQTSPAVALDCFRRIFPTTCFD